MKYYKTYNFSRASESWRWASENWISLALRGKLLQKLTSCPVLLVVICLWFYIIWYGLSVIKRHLVLICLFRFTARDNYHMMYNKLRPTGWGIIPLMKWFCKAGNWYTYYHFSYTQNGCSHSDINLFPHKIHNKYRNVVLEHAQYLFFFITFINNYKDRWHALNPPQLLT